VRQGVGGIRSIVAALAAGFLLGGAVYITYYWLRDLYVGDSYSVYAAWARFFGGALALSTPSAGSRGQPCRRRCATTAWLSFISVLVFVGPGNPEILRAVHGVITRQSSLTFLAFLPEIQVALVLPLALAFLIYARCTRNASGSQGKQRGSSL
jgi:hypothetical protein